MEFSYRPTQLKSLPQYINGFKTIECHGYDTERGVRWATVECKACKKEYQVDPNKLQYRKHCGCMKKNVITCRYAKSHPQLAQAFKHMKARCYNKNNQDYYNYGARGITICDEWLRDRNVFCEWSLKNGFENDKKLSIDRIDSNKGYSPQNCRWVKKSDQARNKRSNILTMEMAREIRKLSATMRQCELSRKYGICKTSIRNVVIGKTWRENADI